MRRFELAGVMTVAVLCAASFAGAAPRTTPQKKAVPATVRLGGTAYRISGPSTYRNLTVFLLHARSKDTADYLTLQEGLRTKVVRVAEKDQEEVSELVITNDSDRPLFLQEGDRVIGGKQDRIISSSLVIPPYSRRVPLPAFCVEQGRWSEGERQRSFGAASEPAMAPAPVRRAAKVANNQSEVWDNVAKAKETAGHVAGAPQRTTSLNEALESPGFKKVADGAVSSLKSLVAKSPDAVGVAIAVNGRIEEVDVYPNHALLVRLYPQLLRSFALDAARHSGQVRAASLKASDLVSFLSQRKAAAARSRKIDARNSMRVQDLPTAVQLETSYGGKAVHQQYMRK